MGAALLIIVLLAVAAGLALALAPVVVALLAAIQVLGAALLAHWLPVLLGVGLAYGVIWFTFPREARR